MDQVVKMTGWRKKQIANKQRSKYMTKDEALKLSLEAAEIGLANLTSYQSSGNSPTIHEYGQAARALAKVRAAKEVLAQPEQEPVAWTDGPHLVMRTDWRDRANYKGPWVDIGRAIPDSWVPVLYTTPPQREWVGLTDKERETATGWSVEHIEDFLKQKNGFAEEKNK